MTRGSGRDDAETTGPAAAIHAAVVEAPVDDADLRRRVSRPSNGAVLVFHGVVRDHHEGRPVGGVHYEAYRPMAESELRALADECSRRHGGLDVAVVHRVGTLAVGEASLVVAVGAPHRAPAFACGLEIIDEIKRRVPVWKQEIGPDGRRWQDGFLPQA
jgi:molybdopterin synthase catalytic subunit